MLAKEDREMVRYRGQEIRSGFVAYWPVEKLDEEENMDCFPIEEKDFVEKTGEHLEEYIITKGNSVIAVMIEDQKKKVVYPV